MTHLPLLCAILLLLVSATAGDKKVTFYLFTKLNTANYIEIDSENASKYVACNSSVVLLVHGWKEDSTTKWMPDLKNALLSHTNNYNVILVDYREVSQEPYLTAVIDISQVGAEIGALIISLINESCVSLKQVSFIGHSLGAQVGAHTSKYISDKTSKKLPIITGLDPAGPLFEAPVKLTNNGLSRDDADVVYVIHTDAGKFGIVGTVGSTDVFVNGGTAIQPGCPDFAHNDILFCSHRKSHQYYIYAVAHPGLLLAVRCGSYNDFKAGKCNGNEMIDIGGLISLENEGKYYLRTTATAPYKLVP